MITGSLVEDLKSRAKWKDNVGLMPHVRDQEFIMVEFEDETLGYGVPSVYYDWSLKADHKIKRYAVVTLEDFR
jgi:hypothetical protein